MGQTNGVGVITDAGVASALCGAPPPQYHIPRATHRSRATEKGSDEQEANETMPRRYFNGLRTAMLLGLLTALVLGVGYWWGGGSGLAWATPASVALNATAYFWSDKIALAAVRANPVPEHEAPALYAALRELTAAAGQPMPRLYISPLAQPNAFATGRDPAHAAVCVTDGLLRLLSPREVRAVLAHEISHIMNRDILISSVAAGLAGIVTSLAHVAVFLLPAGDDEDAPNPLAALLTMLLAPLAAGVIQLAVSRSREFQADADGANLSRDPLALARALEKIEHGAEKAPTPPSPSGISHAHLMIANPLSRSDGLSALFRSHPATSARVRRLRQLAIEARAHSRFLRVHGRLPTQFG